MRIAIILSGNIRTWERSNLHDFVNVNVDFFITTTNKKYNYHPYVSGKYGYESINEQIISDSEILEICPPNTKKILITEDDIIIRDNFAPNLRDIDTCYHQYNRIYKILSHISDFENENGFQYDLIVKTRFDLYYYGKLSHYIQNLTSERVIYDDGNDTLVISERHTFFNIINFIISEFYNQTDPFSHEYPPHGLLNAAIRKYGLFNDNKRLNEIIRF